MTVAHGNRASYWLGGGWPVQPFDRQFRHKPVNRFSMPKRFPRCRYPTTIPQPVPAHIAVGPRTKNYPGFRPPGLPLDQSSSETYGHRPITGTRSGRETLARPSELLTREFPLPKSNLLPIMVHSGSANRLISKSAPHVRRIANQRESPCWVRNPSDVRRIHFSRSPIGNHCVAS